MNPRLSPIVRNALAAAREDQHDPRDAGPLISLLRRYRNRRSRTAFASDTELISSSYGADVARIRVTRADVHDILQHVVAELATMPRKSQVVANIVAAPEDDQSVPAVVAVLAQFEPPAAAEDELSVTTLLTALRSHGDDQRAADALQRWLGDLGEAGDRAREAIARARYSTPEWRRRQRSWQTVADVVDDAAGAMTSGWDAAPPVWALSALLGRARARRLGDHDEVSLANEILNHLAPRIADVDVSRAHASAIVHRLGSEAPDIPWVVEPLSEILLAADTEEVVPYLLRALSWNDARSGLLRPRARTDAYRFPLAVPGSPFSQ